MLDVFEDMVGLFWNGEMCEVVRGNLVGVIGMMFVEEDVGICMDLIG